MSWKRQVSWQEIPSIFDMRMETERDPLTYSFLYIMALCGIPTLWMHPDPSWFFSSIFVSIALVGFILIFFLKQFWIILYSTIPLANNTGIVILHVANFQNIVDEIYECRRRFLVTKLPIDSELSVRSNLRKFQWLLREGVIDRQEFLDIQTSLLPEVTQPLLRPPIESGQSLAIEQKHLTNMYYFKLEREHLCYGIKSFSGRRSSQHIRYDALPNFRTLFEFTGRDQLNIVLPLGLLLVSVTFLHSVAVQATRSPFYYYGWPGLQHTIWDLALPVLGAIAIPAALERCLRLRYTRILPKLFVIIDKQHDRILAELQARRAAALRWYAESDPLLTIEEQKGILAHLLQEQLISQEEFTAYLANAHAIQERLNLDAPATAAPDAPPPQTIH